MPPPSAYNSKVRVHDRYNVVGFISSGTYGRVYKALGRNGRSGEFAIKKQVHYRPARSDSKLMVAGSSRIKRVRLCSTLAFPSQHVEKWLCARS